MSGIGGNERQNDEAAPKLMLASRYTRLFWNTPYPEGFSLQMLFRRWS